MSAGSDYSKANQGDFDVLLKEYDSLRDEVLRKIELNNTLITFTITTVVAVIAVAVSEGMNTLLFLVPFAILIPMTLRVAYYRTAINKLSAYIIVFLEDEISDINWESRSVKRLEKQGKVCKSVVTRFNAPRCNECLVLAVVCYILYFVTFIGSIELTELTRVTVFNLGWPILFVVVEFFIVRRVNLSDKEKNWWIEQWKEVKRAEQGESIPSD